ncbi:MAG: AAA family ATPase [Anaerolineales bacterium]|nr:AAA family ATPase [Chloroflexota bacterium]MBL6982410.1 AAA family ATPase [Anaerolineales bacterium]
MSTCTNCQFSNPQGAKFCSNCGSQVKQGCTNCGAELIPNAKFCSNCGQPAQVAAATQTESAQPAKGAAPPAAAPQGPEPAQTSPAPTSSNLGKYVPAALLSKLEAARDGEGAQDSLGERRIVTMVFCDIQGSTAAAGKLDPEEWHEIVNGAFEHMIAPVYKYEGIIARLMGDGILAFFGAPIAHEDDPQRAVLASLEILEGIEIYREKILKEWNMEVNVRVGINTGLVVVGGVGSDLRMEYTALGDAINLAARMEQTAEPGTIQISADTHRLVAPIFSFEDLGGVQVKGKEEPVQTYRVLGIKTAPGQIRGIEGLDAPLIGRDSEMHTLRGIVIELREGRGQIVSVMGEAGLGKSRLVSELYKSPTPVAGKKAELVWMEGRSLSYETTTPYAPFVDLFKQHFDLETLNTDSDRYQAIKSRLTHVAPDSAEEIAPYFASMLEIEITGEDAERVRYLAPPQLRQGVYNAVLTYVETLASQSPLVLVLDDVHWIDPTSLDLMEQLLPLTERVPFLLMALFRPRRQEPSWQFHENAARDYAHRYQSVILQPLSKDNSRELVANLLEVDDLPKKVRTMIMEKAEGNPFYVEEVIRSLLDSGLVIRKDGHWQTTEDIENISVPDTLSAVITTRLDQLDEDSRQVAQTASVIGRQFPFNVLETVHYSKVPLDRTLTDLQRRELIREKSRMPERVYMFKHTLTQETVYASLLLKKRRELHKTVAECLEANDPERVNEIGRHFMEARQFARALPYLVQAGNRAAKAYSTKEAIELYTQTIDLLEKVDLDIELARSAYEGLGGALEFAYDFPNAAETYRQMIAFGEKHADIPMQVSGKNKLAKAVGFGMAQLPEALQLLEEAEMLASQVNDLPGLAEGGMIQCAFCTARADFDGAVNFLGQAVKIGRQLEAIEPRLYGLTHIANTYTFMGLFEDAWETVEDALALATETGNRQYISELLTFSIPFYHIRNGDIELARNKAQEGTDIARQIGSISSGVSGNFVLGFIAKLQGEYEKAMHHFQQALDINGGSIPYQEAMILGLMGSTVLDLGPGLKEKVLQYHDKAEALLENPIGGIMGAAVWAELGFCAMATNDLEKGKIMFELGMTTPTAMMHLSRPQLLIGSASINMMEGDIDSAQELLEEAQTYIDERKMKHVAPFIHLAMGKVMHAKGEIEVAIEQFTQAEETAQALGYRPTIWQAQASAADALQMSGQNDNASEKRTHAIEMVNEIESFFEDQELRDVFITNAMNAVITDQAVTANSAD